MNKYDMEVATIGKDIFKLANGEFPDGFFIVARNTEMLVLGNSKKNMEFCLKKRKISDQHFFEKTARISRKQ